MNRMSRWRVERVDQGERRAVEAASDLGHAGQGTYSSWFKSELMGRSSRRTS